MSTVFINFLQIKNSPFYFDGLFLFAATDAVKVTVYLKNHLVPSVHLAVIQLFIRR